MAQIVNILATDECQLNLDLVGDYDIMLNSVTGTMNIPIVVKNEDYVVYEVPYPYVPEVQLDDTYDETGYPVEHFRSVPWGTYRCVVGCNVYVTSSVFSTINDFIRHLYNEKQITQIGLSSKGANIAKVKYFNAAKDTLEIESLIAQPFDNYYMEYAKQKIKFWTDGTGRVQYDEEGETDFTVIRNSPPRVHLKLYKESTIVVISYVDQVQFVYLEQKKEPTEWDNFSRLIELDSLTGHLKFKCNILDASPRMRYILGLRYVLPQIGPGDLMNMDKINPGMSERPPFLLGSPYYFIYVENAKCRSRFVWYPINLVYIYYNMDEANLSEQKDYGMTKPNLTAQEIADEQNFIPASSKVLYNKILNHHSTYAATHQILNVIYNSFTPGTMFQFSGGQFTCSGETLSNVKLRIVGMFGEPMNNLSEVLWNFQLAPVQPPQPPPGVTKEGLAQIEAQKAEQEQQALLAQQQAEQQAALAQQQADAAAQGQEEMQAVTQMIMDLKEENQKLLQMIIDQRQQINNAVAKDKKEDVKIGEKLIAPHLPTAFVGKGPGTSPFKPPDPVKVETISKDNMAKAIADAFAKQQQAQQAAQPQQQGQGQPQLIPQVQPLQVIPQGGAAPAPQQAPPAPNPYNVQGLIPPPPPPPPPGVPPAAPQ